jgi:integrase
MIEPRHGWVKVNGQEVEYPQGRYYLRTYKERKKVYTPIESSNPRDVAHVLDRAQRHARAAGMVRNPLTLIKNAADAYVNDLKRRLKFEAARQARLTLDQFIQGVCDKERITTVKGITRETVLKFHDVLRKRRRVERTVANKDTRLRSWFKWLKIDTSFLTKADKPTFEESEPTIYNPAELRAILDAADASNPCMGIALRMALMLGLREQELMYAEWADVDWHHATFRVQGKTRKGWKFAVKDKAQRQIPIPQDLLSRLTAWHESEPRKKTTLIVGNDEDKPEGHLLRKLKQLARHAGLNCGRCEGCQRKVNPECEQWFLHKFRATFCTRMLRQADAKTVQVLAGHSNLLTTLAYLAAATGEEMQTHANAIKWTD